MINKEIEIPEGYEARIEGNKVIFEAKESEDEKIRTRLIALVEAFGQGKYKNEMLTYLEKHKEPLPIPDKFSGLKSLRPHWKPSEEQMKWLKNVIETVPMTCRQQIPLESLYTDLQKLM